jgi:hypothetical protein
MQAIAQTVHKSTDDEVHRSLDTTFATPLPGLQSTPSTIVAGTLADGTRWDIEVSPRNPRTNQPGYVWWIGQPGDSGPPTETRLSLPGGAPTIETLVEHGRTYVLRKVPRSVSGAELHVNPNGLASSVSPLLDIDPALGDRFTATVSFDPVPFTCAHRRRQRQHDRVVAAALSARSRRRSIYGDSSSTPSCRASSTTRCSGSPITLLTLPVTLLTSAAPAPCTA